MVEAQPRTPSASRSLVRLLIVEDKAADVELIVATLKRAGYSLSFDVVNSPTVFRQRLERAEYDLILCNHDLGTWVGMEALEMLERSGKDIPFIVVTGSLSDEAAVTYIKEGAADYVPKHRLERLPVAVSRALQDKAHREEAARLQEAILSAKREWELTFDTVPDPVLLLDEQCQVQRANRAATAVLGLEFHQLLDKPCWEVLHGLSAPRADCPHYQQRESGKTEQGDIEDSRLGKVFHVRSSPFRDPGGAFRGCVVVMHDITERKRAEESLRASEERYRLLFERNLAGGFRATLDGRIVDCNAACARIFGYASREELLSHTAWEGHLSAAEQEAFLARLREQKTLANVELCFRRKDGSAVWVLENASLVEGEEGTPALIEGTLIDITERKRLEAQLRQSQKMEAVGRLAGGVAHDFNNLLTVITGYSDLLLEELSDDNRLRRAADEIHKAADRAASLTCQLLAFSRRQVLEPKVLHLNQVVSNIDKMLRRLIGEDIDLLTVLEPQLGRVKGDRGQIEQVIMNLALNARDAMPHGGKLTIETANVELDEAYTCSHIAVQPGPYVMLAVSDTGCGMDEETQAHLFEPFFTTKEPGQGTGLGLATVYGIVKQSGGNIWVYSEPERGTTFKIYLPRVEEAVEDAATGEPARHPPSGSETVLLVEDEQSVRQLVGEALRRNGYTVLEASNGAEAIRVCEGHQGPIQLLVTDVVMPEMGGRALAQRLASLRPEMKVLYMSGYTNNAIVHHGVLDPGTAFLQKPFRPADVARKVREVLEGGKEQ